MTVDLKKTEPSYKAKEGEFSIVDVPTYQYLMIDGANGPASKDFTQALEALYPVA